MKQRTLQKQWNVRCIFCLLFFNQFQNIADGLKEIVHEIDHQAYITISEVADVFSNNHDK